MAHQARTKTIFELTGLSRHQLATLRQRWRITQTTRHRGPSPTSFAVFFSTLRTRADGAALAVVLRILASSRVITGDVHGKTSGVELGEQLCEVFETYSTCFPKAELEFEHLMLLAKGLEREDSVALSNCTNCGAVNLIDLYEKRRHLCPHCQRNAEISLHDQQSSERRSEVDRAEDDGDRYRQGELF